MSTAEAARDRSLRRQVGERADRPATAAAAVAATAVVFSAGWFGAYDLVDVEPSAVPLFVATVANAYVVTWLVWDRFVPDGAWSYWRGLLLGGTAGLGSHLTLGYAWLLVGLLGGGGGGLGLFELLVGGLLIGALSVPLTFGIPILLSVAVALGLTYCRRRVATATVPARK